MTMDPEDGFSSGFINGVGWARYTWRSVPKSSVSRTVKGVKMRGTCYHLGSKNERRYFLHVAQRRKFSWRM
jgi:hypothetical protein